ncbi:DUF2865 domain-containing protein [Alsobacter sp. KACC 23698]|uniref:DUF2865 domain-containing protein n=1 Tax=Alsobacter sp. KACC 23698 TaxID=3149229 RepID=A0AAU7JBQ9_9HYPH
MASTGALAQSASCRQLKAEYRSLGDGGGASARQEYAQLAAVYRDMGCNGGGFLFFGPPPACQGVAARLRSLQSAAVSGGGADVQARKAQLRGAIAAACSDREHVEKASASGGYSPRGGRKLVCVRTCDGFFFPLSAKPEDGDVEDMCQSLCPGAETAVFRMPDGGAIQEAVSTHGQAYTALPNALKYRTSVDKSCACKGDGQSWAQALAKAESMIARRSSDIVVDAAIAARMAQASATGSAKSAALKGAKRKPPAGEPGDNDIIVRPAGATAAASAEPASAGPGPAAVRVIAPGSVTPLELSQSSLNPASDIETGAVTKASAGQ